MSAERERMRKFLGLPEPVTKAPVVLIPEEMDTSSSSDVIVINEDVPHIVDERKVATIDLTSDSLSTASRRPLAPIFCMAAPVSTSSSIVSVAAGQKRLSPVVASMAQLPSRRNSHVNFHQDFSNSSTSSRCGLNRVSPSRPEVDIADYACRCNNEAVDTVSPPVRMCRITDDQFDAYVQKSFIGVNFNITLFKSIKERSQVNPNASGLAEKYKPRNLDEFMVSHQDRYKTDLFFDWLQSFLPKRKQSAEISITVDESERDDSDLSSSSSESDDSNDSDFDMRKSSKRRRKARSKKQSSSAFDWDDEEDWQSVDSPWLGIDKRHFLPDRRLMDVQVSLEGARAVMLYSPNSSSKTAMISVLAAQLGYRLLEINSGQKRDGATVAQAINEAVRSHRIDMSGKRNSSGQSILTQHSQNMFTKFMKKKVGDTGSKSDGLTKKSKDITAVVLEEVDVLFERDNGFWRSVLPVLSYSKRPIIMTCNDLTELPDIAVSAIARGMIRLIPFRKPDSEILAAYLTTISKCEGYLLRREHALHLAQESNLKKSLNSLEFLFRSPTTGDELNVNMMTINDDITPIESVAEAMTGDHLTLRVLDMYPDDTGELKIADHIQDLSDRDLLYNNVNVNNMKTCRDEIYKWDLSDYVSPRVLTCQTTDLNSLYLPYLHRILSDHYKEPAKDNNEEAFAETLDRQERLRSSRNQRIYSTRRSGNSSSTKIVDPYFYEIAMRQEDKLVAEATIVEKRIANLIETNYKSTE